MKKNLNVCGLLSMIFGILGLFILPLWFGLAALTLGLVGIVTADKKNYGKGMAIAGVVLGGISLVYYVFVLSILVAA